MPVLRILLVLLVLATGAPGFAASLAERSPFAQGLWWDPGRSGHGFEIWNAGDHVALIWFTYDEAGRPVWYSAAGRRETLGAEAWPLLRHRWSSGAAGSPVVAGSLRLNVRHAESAEVVWDIGGRTGTWAIQPFFVSGVVNEVDHGGVWFDPANPGWGLSLTEQGDVLGGVLYTYDAAGAPTWALGFERGGNGSIAFDTYSGACPACPHRPATASPAGRLSLELTSEAQAIARSSLALPMAPGVAIDGARIAQLGRPASSRAADRQLARFDSGPPLKAFLAAGMMSVPVITTGSFSASPPAVTFSATNLQEAGVDEADLVKSDGSHVYAFAHDGSGVRLPVVRIARVTGDGATFEIRGSVALQSGPATPTANAGLFLHRDKLVSLMGTQASSPAGWPWAQPYAWLRGATHVEVMDVSAPDAPATRWRAEIDGHLVTSRRIGDRLYVVSRFVPYLPQFAYGATSPPAVAANEQLLAATPLSALLPGVRIDGGDAAAAVDVANVHVPPYGGRGPIADMIVVTAIDLAGPRIAQALAILGSAETVYASPGNLFVASSRYVARDGYGFMLPLEPSVYLTDIHQIRLGADGMSIVGSAAIEGILGYDVDKSAFRLSEHQGRLRAVTSSATMWGGTTRNRLTILEPSTIQPGLLKTVGYLPNARRPQTLGKPHEVLYGTRFVGDRLYAVTFKTIDPLYVVDLADAGDPRIAGAVELPGFSEYLHPLPNGLLLGFGKEARPAQTLGDGQFAWYQGLLLTLFDVSKADQPRELQRMVIGKRGSESALLKHHHAFSELRQADGSLSIAIPGRLHDGPTSPYASDSDLYPWQRSGLMRFELRGTGPLDARLVGLPALVTHSAVQGAVLYNDPASNGGRSVLFRNGTVYVGNGLFWRQDSAGNAFGPY
ncbi:MAG: beta-propeller domain-containing protein [Burkholderiales bacterium]|nr:beta-propeller domain-containing protein [Burkholderiales bacterium]